MSQSKYVWPGTSRQQEMRKVLEIKTLWDQRKNFKPLLTKSYKTETSWKNSIFGRFLTE
jgi:hypothetical protein